MKSTDHHPALTRRPHSLAEVVEWASDPGVLDAYLREFLDTFYVCDESAQRQGMLRDAPVLTGQSRTDAYLAAVAEHLAQGDGLPAPTWVDAPERFLKRPFFPCGLESLKARLLVESPPAFRRRMIFVDFDPLYRPRRRTPPEKVLSA
ncbi:MAG: hypothetical protein COS34_05710 [Lysobacterales bacterium CG02_land_8_20_14_3_00_62_12]|nr:MAG: hypothetical protein COS34_05710 [Xanthomonadales bacterium CG02_land_8_20_14_3_00_62_12]